MTAIRTVERGYTRNRRAGQVTRLHVLREEGPRGWNGGEQTWCGQGAWKGCGSTPIIREAPHPLPEGLDWCPKCLGLLAGYLGRTSEVAALLGLAGEAASNDQARQDAEATTTREDSVLATIARYRNTGK